MKPNPFVSLNHFTVPVAMEIHLPHSLHERVRKAMRPPELVLTNARKGSNEGRPLPLLLARGAPLRAIRRLRAAPVLGDCAEIRAALLRRQLIERPGRALRVALHAGPLELSHRVRERGVLT